MTRSVRSRETTSVGARRVTTIATGTAASHQGVPWPFPGPRDGWISAIDATTPRRDDAEREAVGPVTGAASWTRTRSDPDAVPGENRCPAW
jgi:hypothetical protein